MLYLLADQPPDFWHDPLTLTMLGVIGTIIGAIIYNGPRNLIGQSWFDNAEAR